ncbi:methyltransferase domain-containing protein [Bacillus zanthoxyli]|nr:methyltransferase domain-containing protein [Bacillus zanthoxyli]
MTNQYDKTVYNESYYNTSFGGVPYNRESSDGTWIKLFFHIAKQISQKYTLNRVLDVGCAKGFLVENLRDMDVDAYGFDISEYAISQVREDIQPFCRVGSVDDPGQYEGFFDLITCIEILEHVTEEMAENAIELMCKHTNRVIFSSSPSDFEEPTHINVQPAGYWDRLFAENGFVRALDNWVAEGIVSHAVIYQKYNLNEGLEETDFFSQERLNINTIKSLPEDSQELTKTIVFLVEEAKKLTNKNTKLLEQVESNSNQKAVVKNQLQETVETLQAEINMLSEEEKIINQKEEILQKQIAEFHHLINIVKEKLKDCQKKYQQTQSEQQQGAYWNKEYIQWLEETSKMNAKQREQQMNSIVSLKEKPLMSVLLPVYKIPLHILKEAVYSVLHQTYPHWELCIAYGDVDNQESHEFLESLSQEESRIKVNFLKENEGISNNTNRCLNIANGEFVGLLDHDDLLTEDALYEMAKAINENPNADFLYSDFDFINDKSDVRHIPFLKHKWSWPTMISTNYATHFSVLKKSLFSQVGSFDSTFDGAQDWDMFLKVSQVAKSIVYIPKILYHWRIVPSSTTFSLDTKPYAINAQVKALKKYIKQRKLKAQVLRKTDGTFLLIWDLNKKDSYDVLIYGEEEDFTKVTDTLNSLANQYHKPETVKIVFSKNFRVSLELVERYNQYFSIEILYVEESIDPVINSVFKENDSKHLFIVKSGILFSNVKLTHDLNAWLREGNYYAASGKFYEGNNVIRHAGYVIDRNNELVEPYKGMEDNSSTTFGSVNWYREYTAVSECAVMVNKSVFREVLSNYEIKDISRESVLKMQLLVSQHYQCGMLYDPFLEMTSMSPIPAVESININIKINDPYFHPFVWDWNPSFLLTKQMDRKKRIVHTVDVANSVGLEIGPLMNPIVSKREGEIYYVDRANKGELIEKFENDSNVDVEKIEEVDFIWGEKTLREITPPSLLFDYVVASHVIEHVPDVIGWLQEIEEIVKVGGHVCLAIPDKRYTFDYFRELTTTSDIIDPYLNKIRRPSPKQIYDFYSKVANVNIVDAWNDVVDLKNSERLYTEEQAMDFCVESIKNKTYVDVHCTVYTAQSFMDLLKELFHLDLTNFKVHKFYEPERYSLEFILILEKLPKIEDAKEKLTIQLNSLPTNIN